MPVTIYHNPKCATSRATLALLEARGIQPKIVEYLVYPPSKAELEHILKLLGMRPRDLLRNKEPEYKEAGLDDPKLSDATLIRALRSYPRLMQRPIVIANGKAAIGRPPENVLSILK